MHATGKKPHVESNLSLVCIPLHLGVLFNAIVTNATAALICIADSSTADKIFYKKWCLKVLSFTNENHTQLKKNVSFIEKQKEVLSRVIFL